MMRIAISGARGLRLVSAAAACLLLPVQAARAQYQGNQYQQSAPSNYQQGYQQSGTGFGQGQYSQPYQQNQQYTQSGAYTNGQSGYSPSGQYAQSNYSQPGYLQQNYAQQGYSPQQNYQQSYGSPAYAQQNSQQQNQTYYGQAQQTASPSWPSDSGQSANQNPAGSYLPNQTSQTSSLPDLPMPDDSSSKSSGSGGGGGASAAIKGGAGLLGKFLGGAAKVAAPAASMYLMNKAVGGNMYYPAYGGMGMGYSPYGMGMGYNPYGMGMGYSPYGMGMNPYSMGSGMGRMFGF